MRAPDGGELPIAARRKLYALVTKEVRVVDLLLELGRLVRDRSLIGLQIGDGGLQGVDGGGVLAGGLLLGRGGGLCLGGCGLGVSRGLLGLP